jgi:hypothetical protein
MHKGSKAEVVTVLWETARVRTVGMGYSEVLVERRLPDRVCVKGLAFLSEGSLDFFL